MANKIVWTSTKASQHHAEVARILAAARRADAKANKTRKAA
jgi:hypothetical protein